jgi:hypothetical protein
VAITDYNKGRVNAVTGAVDQNLVACIADMLDDANYPELPASDSPVAANQAALRAVAGMPGGQVPFPFLYGILMQESGCQHFHVPGGADQDNFVTVGLDTNDKANPVRITSRGFGIGQYTLFHHPPTGDEVKRFIADALGNVTMAIKELREKFDQFVVGPADQADDRIHEIGHGPLRICRFAAADSRYMSDCVNCLKEAGSQTISTGVTSVYNGSSMTYAHTQYHAGSYDAVPIRKNIPCDWPYAVRRYNGSGADSYDYQAEVLWKMVTTPPPGAQ